jgi:hypothetical protein
MGIGFLQHTLSAAKQGCFCPPGDGRAELGLTALEASVDICTRVKANYPICRKTDKVVVLTLSVSRKP